MSTLRPAPRTFANRDVLEFYESLPFNYRGSVDAHVSAVRRQDPTDQHPVLDPLLRPATRVLDVGCGVGWLSSSIAYHRGSQVTGIDFNAIAIERAREIAKALALSVRFEVADLFLYAPERKFDLAVSLGVLHHTDNFDEGLRRICNSFTKPGGYVYVGLYHAESRRPFIDHFRALQESGKSEQELFVEFRSLAPHISDDIHAKSWFRDQVLHPKETAHTLTEIVPVIEACGMTLVATSINRFAEFGALDELYARERELLEQASQMLRRRRFFPGFFTVLCRKASAE